MRSLQAWVVGCSVWMTSAVHADVGVPAGYRQVAAAHGIPSALFYALALAESGRWIEDWAVSRPWPWALNIEGRGQFYPTRRAAEAALAEVLASGRTSVDVGLMQVSWRYHQPALETPTLALDPYRNLNVAAEILVACRARRDDWWGAVACYHAPNAPERGKRYQDRVRSLWDDLQSSVNDHEY